MNDVGLDEMKKKEYDNLSDEEKEKFLAKIRQKLSAKDIKTNEDISKMEL